MIKRILTLSLVGVALTGGTVLAQEDSTPEKTKEYGTINYPQPEMFLEPGSVVKKEKELLEKRLSQRNVREGIGTRNKPYSTDDTIYAKTNVYGGEEEVSIEADMVISLNNLVISKDDAPKHAQRVTFDVTVSISEDARDVLYPVVVQPIAYGDDYENPTKEFAMGSYHMGQEHSTWFKSHMNQGETETQTLSFLVPDAELTGSLFLLNTGFDKIWLTF